MVFDPKTNKYPYPEYTDEHYLKVNMNRGFVFDEQYPYIDNSASFRFKAFWVRVLLRTIVFPLAYARFGLKVKGRKNLKKHKNEIKNGVISVSNHIHMWDYICTMNAIRPIKPHVLVWAPNVNGESGPLVRLVGGIPIPEDNLPATIKYMDVVKNYLNSGGWLHVYAEGSMWEYYGQIRPFKKGAFYFASQNHKPIIPLAYSYRKPSWWRRVFFKQIATLTVSIGEPIYPDENLSMKDREIDLTKRAHSAVCQLSMTNPEENLYEPIFNKSKRIDYYTTEYGVGYKAK